MTDTAHVAAVALAADLVAGDQCELTIAEADTDDHGQTAMSDRLVYGAVELPARALPGTDAWRAGTAATAAADEQLTAAGWSRTSEWDGDGTVLYADVKRTG